jgi:hypothetical protein
VRANDSRPPGNKLRQRALKVKLHALRRTRRRVLDATPGRDVADLDAAIASVERALG